ncbi:MAG: hypothetical protein R3323_03115 [Wenzhouxiangellaceae bacterium]|nr:hypothetical protein [Wenzhouxiangellaceae bacterium]
MSFLITLWLPIVVTTIVLFLASFLFWAVSPHHKPDVRKWPDEDRLLAFIRESGAEPGQYVFPLIQPEEMKQDAAQRRYREGPWGQIVLWSSQPNMPMNMVKTVLLFLVVTVLVAYLGALALPAGASFGDVFQVVGTAAILAHTTGGMLNEIWFSKPLRAKITNALDGIAYGVLTGVIFGWLWPGIG